MDDTPRGLACVSGRRGDRAMAGDGKSSLIPKKGGESKRELFAAWLSGTGPRFGDLGRNGQLRGIRQGPQTAMSSKDGWLPGAGFDNTSPALVNLGHRDRTPPRGACKSDAVKGMALAYKAGSDSVLFGQPCGVFNRKLGDRNRSVDGKSERAAACELTGLLSRRETTSARSRQGPKPRVARLKGIGN